MNKQDEEKLHKEMIALFLLMLKYSNSSRFKPLLVLFKSNREFLKAEINKIYATYTKDGELKMTSTQISKEIKKLELKFRQIGNDLVKKESEILNEIMALVYVNTYSKTYNIISQYKELNTIKQVADSIINKSINQKINDLTAFDRNKNNKQQFINKTKKNIEVNLKRGTSIEKINKIIDANFNISANQSNRLVKNEIARNFNNAQNEAYQEADIQKIVYNSILEISTCAICANLDQTIFDRDNAPDLPLHVNCQCFYTPII